MADSGITLSGLRGSLEPQSLLARPLRARIDRATLRLSAEALAKAIPPGKPLRVERIGRGRIEIHTSFTPIGGVVELAVEATQEGRARFRLVAFRAAGLIGLPKRIVMGLARGQLPAIPGLYPGEEDYIEVDFSEIARRVGVELAPLRRATAEEGAVVFEFAGPERPEVRPSAAPPGSGTKAAAPPAASAPEPPPAPPPSASEPPPPPPGEPVVRVAIDPLEVLSHPQADPAGVEALFPATLRMAEGNAGAGTLSGSFTVTNTLGGLLSCRFRARPSWVLIEPETLALRPGTSGRVQVRASHIRLIDEKPTKVELEATWSLLDSSGGAPRTISGKRTVRVESDGWAG